MYAGLALTACTAAAATYVLVPVDGSDETVAAAAPYPGTPTAQEFADYFVGTANAFAGAHGDTTRFGNADCVQATRGHYMCSYTAKQPGVAPECHVMQGRWTPKAASTITVTLSSRTARCRTLADALQSLS
jgi:hypothetical protein